MDVHNIGESGGCRVVSCAIAPFSTRRWTFGILPASINGWITFQSAASQPMSRTLAGGFLEAIAIGWPAPKRNDRPRTCRGRCAGISEKLRCRKLSGGLEGLLAALAPCQYPSRACG